MALEKALVRRLEERLRDAAAAAAAAEETSRAGVLALERAAAAEAELSEARRRAGELEASRRVRRPRARWGEGGQRGWREVGGPGRCPGEDGGAACAGLRGDSCSSSGSGAGLPSGAGGVGRGRTWRADAAMDTDVLRLGGRGCGGRGA